MTQIPGWIKTGKSKLMGPYSKQRYYTRKKQEQEQLEQEIYNKAKS